MQNKDEYLDSVCEEIRFKAARKYLRRELEQHIDDKTQEFLSMGTPDAETSAVASMGDASETGRALNALHRPRTEWGVIICLLLLSAAGVFASYAGSTYGPYNDMISWLTLQNILFPSVAAGLCITAVIYFADYTWLKRLRHVLFGAAILYIGAYLFLNFPLHSPYAFQGFLGQSAVITVSTLFFILSITGYVQYSSGSIKGLVHITALCGISVFAMSLLSSVSSLLLSCVFVAILGIYIHNSGQPKKWIRFAFSSGTIAAIFLVCLLLPKSWFVFGTNIGESSYSTQMVQDMLKGARLVGSSPQYLQNNTWSLRGSTTGYILTAVIGAYGWLAGIAIVLTSIALLLFMASRSRRIADPFGRLLTSGIIVLFFVRFALFTFANMGLISGISINLPFVSYGNFSYIANAILIGIFLSVWRRSSFMKQDFIHENIKPESLNATD